LVPVDRRKDLTLVPVDRRKDSTLVPEAPRKGLTLVPADLRPDLVHPQKLRLKRLLSLKPHLLLQIVPQCSAARRVVLLLAVRQLDSVAVLRVDSVAVLRVDSVAVRQLDLAAAVVRRVDLVVESL